jgi:hypothetical protein
MPYGLNNLRTTLDRVQTKTTSSIKGWTKSINQRQTFLTWLTLGPITVWEISKMGLTWSLRWDSSRLQGGLPSLVRRSTTTLTQTTDRRCSGWSLQRLRRNWTRSLRTDKRKSIGELWRETRKLKQLSRRRNCSNWKMKQGGQRS